MSRLESKGRDPLETPGRLESRVVEFVPLHTTMSAQFALSATAQPWSQDGDTAQTPLHDQNNPNYEYQTQNYPQQTTNFENDNFAAYNTYNSHHKTFNTQPHTNQPMQNASLNTFNHTYPHAQPQNTHFNSQPHNFAQEQTTFRYHPNAAYPQARGQADQNFRVGIPVQTRSSPIPDRSEGTFSGGGIGLAAPGMDMGPYDHVGGGMPPDNLSGDLTADVPSSYQEKAPAAAPAAPLSKKEKKKLLEKELAMALFQTPPPQAPGPAWDGGNVGVPPIRWGSDGTYGVGGQVMEQNPLAYGETRICFSFLNRGYCDRESTCRFRHLSPDHPDAIADRRRDWHTSRESHLSQSPHGYLSDGDRILGGLPQQRNDWPGARGSLAMPGALSGHTGVYGQDAHARAPYPTYTKQMSSPMQQQSPFHPNQTQIAQQHSQLNHPQTTSITGQPTSISGQPMPISGQHPPTQSMMRVMHGIPPPVQNVGELGASANIGSILGGNFTQPNLPSALPSALSASIAHSVSGNLSDLPILHGNGSQLSSVQSHSIGAVPQTVSVGKPSATLTSNPLSHESLSSSQQECDGLSGLALSDSTGRPASLMSSGDFGKGAHRAEDGSVEQDHSISMLASLGLG